MTKKSHARQMRDSVAKAAEDNKCWDTLNELHASCSNALFTANNELLKVLDIKDLFPFFDNPSEVSTAIRGVSNDISAFHVTLDQIHSLHSERTGGFTTPDDLSSSFVIFEQYQQWQSKYDSIILPTVEFILEKVAIAADRLYAHLANQTETASFKDSENQEIAEGEIVEAAPINPEQQ